MRTNFECRSNGNIYDVTKAREHNIVGGTKMKKLIVYSDIFSIFIFKNKKGYLIKRVIGNPILKI